MFDILEDPFKELKTEHLRLKALENLGFFIKTTEVQISSKKKKLGVMMQEKLTQFLLIFILFH
jgi:hypothetical protein